MGPVPRYTAVPEQEQTERNMQDQILIAFIKLLINDNHLAGCG